MTCCVFMTTVLWQSMSSSKSYLTLARKSAALGCTDSVSRVMSIGSATLLPYGNSNADFYIVALVAEFAASSTNGSLSGHSSGCSLKSRAFRLRRLPPATAKLRQRPPGPAVVPGHTLE